jgi:hypothetical protein
MDILDHVALVRSCELCDDTYEVSARTVRAAETMLEGACPVDSDRECPQLQYAAMNDPALLDRLRDAWADVESAASLRGCELALSDVGHAPARTPASSELLARIEAYRAAKIEALRVARAETRIERDGHYDNDTVPCVSTTFTAAAEAERNAAIALADELLERTGRRCCA